ncbi:MAG: ATP-binding protein [Gemmatimonadota bacterium]|jgi:signal transduction histidine kinase
MDDRVIGPHATLGRLGRDVALWIAAALLLIAAAPYAIPLLDAEQFGDWRYIYSDIPIALAGLVAATWGTRRLGSSSERHFWRLVGLAYAAVAVGELTNAFLPDAAYTAFVRLLVQSAFLVYYGALMMAAAASQGGAANQNLWNLHRLRSIGLGVMGLGFLVYYQVVPDDGGVTVGMWYPGLFLYTALDVVTGLMFLRAYERHEDERWRGILAGLAIVSGLYAVVDAWEAILWLEPFSGAEIAPLWDFAWFVPPLAFVLVARRYLSDPRKDAVDTRMAHRPRPDRGLLVVGLFAFPVVHVVSYYFGLLDPDLRGVREGVVALFVLVMGAITLLYLRWLERERATGAAELALSEERYRSFVQARSDGIYRAEADPPIPVSEDVDEQIDRIERLVRVAEANDVAYLPSGVPSTRVGGSLVELFPSGSLWREGLRRWIESGYQIELEVVHEDDEGQRWYYRYGLTGIVEDGALRRIWLTRSNVTPKRRADEEAQRLHRELERARKMESLGTLAGGLAHDFNNLLAPIMGYTELAREAIRQNDAGAADNLEHVLSASKRAADLVEQILLASRERPRRRVPVRLQDMVRVATKLVRSGLPASIAVEMSVDDACPPVLGDAGRLHQIVMNLCTNAADAIGARAPSGRIGISVRHETEPEETSAAEGWVVLEVRDDGKGVNPAIQERVFEPFFTTKQPGEGPGLGLSVVHGIVTSHHGRISFESQPGKGTTVTVRFPATAPAKAAESSKVRQIRRPLRILVVDDEAAVAGVTGSILEAYGHSVTSITDPYEALKELRREPGRYDVVVTDYSMPGLTGLDLVDAVREVSPGTGVVLSSGYNLSDREEGSGVVHLAKPFTTAQLAETVQRAKEMAGAC